MGDSLTVCLIVSVAIILLLIFCRFADCATCALTWAGVLNLSIARPPIWPAIEEFTNKEPIQEIVHFLRSEKSRSICKPKNEN